MLEYEDIIICKATAIIKILSIVALAGSLTVNNLAAFAQNISNTNQISSSSFNINIIQSNIPTAESVYQSQSMTLPSSVKTFVWYIVNEAHENSVNEKHKYASDHNPIYIPTNITIPQGTAITFLDADAPGCINKIILSIS